MWLLATTTLPYTSKREFSSVKPLSMTQTFCLKIMKGLHFKVCIFGYSFYGLQFSVLGLSFLGSMF